MAGLPADKEQEESACGQGRGEHDGRIYGLDDDLYEGGQGGALAQPYAQQLLDCLGQDLLVLELFWLLETVLLWFD